MAKKIVGIILITLHLTHKQQVLVEERYTSRTFSMLLLTEMRLLLRKLKIDKIQTKAVANIATAFKTKTI